MVLKAIWTMLIIVNKKCFSFRYYYITIYFDMKIRYKHNKNWEFHKILVFIFYKIIFKNTNKKLV